MSRPDRFTRVPWRAVVVFTVVAMALAWAVAIPVWVMDPARPGYQALFGAIASGMMFTPLVATLAVVFVLKSPRAHWLRFTGIWPLRPARRVVWFIVLGLLSPIALVALSVWVASLHGWIQLDLVAFSGFAEVLDAQLATMGMDASSLGLPPVSLLVLAQIAAIPLGALFNCLFAFGEEVGWRGWLLPALRPLGTWPALLISSAIWGLWHAPVILLGYNFNRTDIVGVLLMVAGCIAWGVFFGWLRLRSASLWPAVIAHGSLNAAAGLFMLLGTAGEQPDPALVSPLGVAGWIVLAACVLVLFACGQFKKQPELAQKPQDSEEISVTTTLSE
ncbi:CPBP family intramembrane metalloprotease [Leucobacter sp. cx-42]|uniref:CPBP family intramembrane glutamic endopeptidase n=1 Tax=unclassified Leucobacter TaxID=2621730 RepID=UPI00165E8281|nr:MULTISPECIES: type II CAAX endopeptidase family protein [unclassified Leucobacter]MBC9954557.1 CPBP family intramembrane metalloprotease [Leucobacter sp. cx-42]